MAKITILFCLYSTVLLSQNIAGKLYDAEAPIAGAKIMNLTSKAITSSDGKGNFEIYAEIKDTLIFKSLFHHTKKLVVTADQLDGQQVFELRKITTELDEVSLAGPTKLEMDEEKASKQLNQQFKNDIEKYGYKYKKPNTGPLNLMAIGESFLKLFKRKKPKEHPVVETELTYEDLVILFKTDDFFNDKFLILNLNITKDYKHLFFAFCESQQMSSSLLRPENQIYLVDKFLECSEAFTEILRESNSRSILD